MSGSTASANQVRIGGCIIAERARTRDEFDLPALRLKELNSLIMHRWHGILPSLSEDEGEDSADNFLFHAATAIHAAGHFDQIERLSAWIQRFMPWRSSPDCAARDQLERIKSRKISSGIRAGKALYLTAAEREEMGIRTISPSDLAADALASYFADRKRKSTCASEARRRARAGAQTRDEYLDDQRRITAEKSREYKEKGISRATLYRRKADGKRNVESATYSGAESHHTEPDDAPVLGSGARETRSVRNKNLIITAHEPRLTARMAPLFEHAARLLSRPLKSTDGFEK